MQRAASGLSSFVLTPQRLISLPQRGPRRLVAVDTDAPWPLRELKSRLVTRLARNRSESRRTYLPHLTLARFRRPDASAAVDEPIARAAELAFAVTGILLMRSTLSADGAVHHEVARVALEPA